MKKQFLQRVKERALVQTPCVFSISQNKPTYFANLWISPLHVALWSHVAAWPMPGEVLKGHREITSWCRNFAAENRYDAMGNGLLGGKNCQVGPWPRGTVMGCDDVDLKIRGSYVFFGWCKLMILADSYCLDPTSVLKNDSCIYQNYPDSSWLFLIAARELLPLSLPSTFIAWHL